VLISAFYHIVRTLSLPKLLELRTGGAEDMPAPLILNFNFKQTAFVSAFYSFVSAPSLKILFEFPTGGVYSFKSYIGISYVGGGRMY